MSFCLDLSFDPSYTLPNFRTPLPLKKMGESFCIKIIFIGACLVVGPDVTLHQREITSHQSVYLSAMTLGNRKLIAFRIFLRCDHKMGATLQSPDSSAGLSASCTSETSIIERPWQSGSPKKPQRGCEVSPTIILQESLHHGKVGGEMQTTRASAPSDWTNSSPPTL